MMIDYDDDTQWPGPDEVAIELGFVRDAVRDAREAGDIKFLGDFDYADGECTYYADVCLQVHADGSWALCVGDPGYDTDDRGHWGCVTVGPDMDSDELFDLAESLIDEAHDMTTRE